MFTSIFGMVVEVKEMSQKDRLERKTYMHICMWESEIMAMIMSMFPSIVIRHMKKENSNMNVCNSGSCKNPRR
jgi:hypothetical protein